MIFGCIVSKKYFFFSVLFCVFMLPFIVQADEGEILVDVQQKPTQVFVENQLSPEVEVPLESKTHHVSFQALFVKTMCLVFFLLVAATAGLYLLKKAQGRFMQPQGGASITNVEKRSLSQKTHVYVVHVGDEKIFVVESVHHISVNPLGNKVKVDQESINAQEIV